MKTLGTHLAVLLVGVGLGVGAIAVADQPSASSSATDKAVLKELQKLNRGIGSSGLRAQLKDGFDDVHDDLADTCRALGGQATSCPDFSRGLTPP